MKETNNETSSLGPLAVRVADDHTAIAAELLRIQVERQLARDALVLPGGVLRVRMFIPKDAGRHRYPVP
jgi:hypothetical protein